MQEIISFRGLDALKNSSENSNRMAQLAGEDSSNMLQLTTKAQRDSETLKKITIVTMIYLPASFVAQFLSMGYLKVNSAKRPASLNFASELWIFAILTLVLFAITFGLWWYFDSTSRSLKLSRRLWWRGLHRRKSAEEKV
jgi:Mg2+ and Co2+ transporter CorA